MQQSSLSLKQILQIVILVFSLLIAYAAFITIDRIGKERVSIEVIPRDASIYVNDKKINSGDNYIKKGTYKFSVKREGFKSITQTIIVPKGGVDIGFAPDPLSSEAKKLLQNKPDTQYKREAIGGKMSDLQGSYIRENNPIINDLPYIDIDGPFAIDYSGDGEYGSIIYISDSTPSGREGAIKWMYDSGYDPAYINIKIKDYENPLVGGDIND